MDWILSALGLNSWKAFRIFCALLALRAAVVLAFIYIIHLIIWVIWYLVQMKYWKRDFANAFDEEEQERLLHVRASMRKKWIPLFFLFFKD